ncbi:MAG: 5-bromo-4-chloroindolyl phosphate hydrolysis family protein [Anaerofustis sp.]
MEYRWKRSVIPIYLIGVVWVLYALIFPLYRLSDFLFVIGVSAAVYFVFAAILPKQKIAVERPALLEKTSDAQLNEIIREANGYIRLIRQANESIPGAAVSAKIDRIEELTKSIFQAVIDKKEPRSKVRRFLNYYLPTTVKLLETYHSMEAQTVGGENISVTMEKIDEMLTTVIQAFEKQLDSLYANDAMDVSADISVMQSIMKQEGLIDSPSPQQQESKGE